MIYKSFSETELFRGETNKTYEYHINDKDINFCIAEINGRFPKEKWIRSRWYCWNHDLERPTKIK